MKDQKESVNQIVLASQLDEVSVSAELIKSDDFSKKYQSLDALINYLKQIKSSVDTEIKNLIEKEYAETGESSIKNSDYTFSYVPSSSRESIDKDKLKELYPDVYKDCLCSTGVASSLRVTKKKKKETESKDKKDNVIDAEFTDF